METAEKTKWLARDMKWYELIVVATVFFAGGILVAGMFGALVSAVGFILYLFGLAAAAKQGISGNHEKNPSLVSRIGALLIALLVSLFLIAVVSWVY